MVVVKGMTREKDKQWQRGYDTALKNANKTKASLVEMYEKEIAELKTKVAELKTKVAELKYLNNDVLVTHEIKDTLTTTSNYRDYTKYIIALRKCADEHKDDITPTFEVIVSDLCSDTADLLEQIMKGE